MLVSLRIIAGGPRYSHGVSDAGGDRPTAQSAFPFDDVPRRLCRDRDHASFLAVRLEILLTPGADRAKRMAKDTPTEFSGAAVLHLD